MFSPSIARFPWVSLFRGRKQPVPKSHVPVAGQAVEPGCALSLVPARAGRLRIMEGRAWVTLGGPYQGSPMGLGDCFLDPGESLEVPAGARLVIEPLALRGDRRTLRFEWVGAAR